MALSSLTRSFGWMLAAIAAFAVISRADEWDEKFKELCTYDHQCQHIRDFTNGWKAPAPDIVDVLRTARPSIQAASKLYGVDPRAIAGAILTENSINLPLKHQAEKWVASFLSGDHQIFGKRFGSGIGQLHDDIAIDVEPRAAAVEKRAKLTNAEVRMRMLTVEGSVYYIAAILKDAQDIYRKHGFEISKDIGLLTTLYNLGNYERRAQLAVDEKRKPRVNHFGFFVLHNEPLLDSVVGKPLEAKADFLAPSDPAPTAGVQARVPAYSQPVRKGPLIIAASQPIELTNVPALCDQSQNRAKISTVPANMSFKVVAGDVDCDLKKWSLIQGDDGSTGWASNENLKSKTQKIDHAAHCETKPDRPCEQKLQAALKDRLKPSSADNQLTIGLNKIADCNSGNEKIPEDIDPSTMLTYEDLLDPQARFDLFQKVRGWETAVRQLSSINPQLDSLVKKIQSSSIDQSSSDVLFAKKAVIAKLNDFFAKQPDPQISAQDADQFVKTLESVKVSDSFSDRFAGSIFRYCNLPNTFPKSRTYIQGIKYLLTTLDPNLIQASYYNLTPERQKLSDLAELCSKESSPQGGAASAVPTGNPSGSPTGASTASQLIPGLAAGVFLPLTIGSTSISAAVVSGGAVPIVMIGNSNYALVPGYNPGMSLGGGQGTMATLSGMPFTLVPIPPSGSTPTPSTSGQLAATSPAAASALISVPAPAPQNVTGVCRPASSASSASSVASTIAAAEAACAKLDKTDDELLSQFKKTLSVKDILGSHMVEVRDCGYDLKDAVQALKPVLATGCVKNVYVDSLTSFDMLAASGIQTIYRPMKEEGQFKIEPKAKVSCDQAGGAK